MSAPLPSIRFWPHTADPRVASTRIRCLQVLTGLQGEKVDAALYQQGERPEVLVLSKRYDEASLAHALALRQRAGTRLVLDICDNHFHAEGEAPQWLARAERLKRACAAVDRVVTASDVLADVVRQSVGEGTAVRVLPDALDLGRAGPLDRHAGDALHALRLRAFHVLHRVAPGRRLLWFGNHGAAYAGGGMQDLDRIRAALTEHHREAPLSLVVVSNRWRKFRQLRRGWHWPALYLPWSGANFDLALRNSDVALIPAQRNPFTLCKTNNRLATAFMRGLAVAADALPSYEEFGDLAVLDDWGAGLGALMASAAERERRVAAARRRLEERYRLDVITQRWLELIDELRAR